MSCEAERKRESWRLGEKSESERERKCRVEWPRGELAEEKNGAKKPSVLTILFSH